jgi:NIPSNAP
MGVVELRQYTLRPGGRDVLVELFDREFVDSQEALGMEIVGQFRDLDRLDRFVWLRGFPDMVRRRQALAAFYGGPVWKAYGPAANATMLDSDDVLLLRPATPTSGFAPLPRRHEAPPTLVVATVCSLDLPADASAVDPLLQALAGTGSSPLGIFVEEPAENTFPALPVRTGEHVVVWFQGFPAGSPDTRLRAERDLATELIPHLTSPPLQLRLEPTPRSRLR